MTETTTTPAPIAHTTRRNLLIAAPAVVAAVAIPAVAAAAPATNRTIWDATMRRYLDAVSRTNDYDRRFWTPAYDAEKAHEKLHGLVHGTPGYWERRNELIAKKAYAMPASINDEYERLITAQCAEEDALMAMPAPDCNALRWKLDKVLEADSDGSTPCWIREYVAQTVADYQRLLGDA